MSEAMTMVCPRCEKPADEGHECVSRGRRFFLLGALFVPVAATLEAPPVAKLFDSTTGFIERPTRAWSSRKFALAMTVSADVLVDADFMSVRDASWAQ